MSKEEVGQRVLWGMERNHLFVLSHPVFDDGISARGSTLLRAIPDEPANSARIEVIHQFGSLLYNPIYEELTSLPGF